MEHTDHCWRCDTPLGEADGLAPPLERGGRLYCDDCYSETYDFICTWCEDCGDREDQHRYLVVWDADKVGLPLPGVYLVRSLPYYTAPLIGRGWFDRHALKWLGALPPTVAASDWYPCGHVCAACQQRLRHDIAVRQGLLHDVY